MIINNPPTIIAFSDGAISIGAAPAEGEALGVSGGVLTGITVGGDPTSPPSPSSEATEVTRGAWTYDLCAEPNDANLLSGADAGTTWVSTNLTSAARASGVITVVHSSTTDGVSGRQDGTQPNVSFDHTPLAGRLVIKASVGTNADFLLLNLYLRNPGGASPIYAINVWNGQLEAWGPRGTATTTTTTATWYMLEWSGNTARVYWSTSAAEPTVYASSAASGWKFLDAATVTDPSAGSRPIVGVGFWHFSTASACTYTISTLRLEAL